MPSDKFESVPPARQRVPNLLRRFVGVVARQRTYLNQAYLWLHFPLGIVYFVVLVTFASLSAGLAVILVGLPLFVLTIWGSIQIATLHRDLTERLTGVEIRAGAPGPPLSEWQAWLKALFLDVRTYTSVVFLCSIFPIGITVFTLLVIGVAMTAATIATPLYYDQVTTGVFVGEPIRLEPSVVFEMESWRVGLSAPFKLSSWYVDTLPEALLMSLFGVGLALLYFNAANLLAKALGLYTKLLLSGTPPSPIDRFTDE